jgi:hypothetical protein
MGNLRTLKLVAPATLLYTLLLANSASAADEISGHVEVGVREVDVQGDENKYDQYLNLDSGARLFGFSARFAPAEPRGSTPDLIDVQLSGLGGEPYERVAVAVKKYGAYRFRYSRHKSDYFYEDLLIRPEDASVEASTGGDFHHFDFERVRDAASLEIDLTERTALSFDFDRYEKTGDSTTTVDIEREEFELDQPIDETWRDVRLGLQHAWEHASLTVSERRQRHENDYSWFLPGFSLGSDPAEPTELNYFFLNQPYDSDVREHALGLTLQPTKKLALTLDVRDIDLELDIDAAESSQGVDFEGTPFTRETSGDGGIDRDTTVMEASGSYAVSERVQLGASVRRYDLDQDGTITFDSEDAMSRWAIEQLSLELSAQFVVSDALSVGVGLHRETRDAEFTERTADGALLRDEETEQAGYFVMAQYRPVTALRLSFELHQNRVDDPYTLASATDARRYRLRARYRVNDAWSLTASHRRTDYDNDDTDWESNSEQSELRAAYTGSRLTLSAAVARIEMDHEIDQLVTGGFRTDRFDIRYAGEATFWDLNAAFKVTDRLQFSAGLRTYDNDGSFDVERDDAELAAVFSLPRDYAVQLSYRNVDYSEGHLEDFDADIWELSLRFDW